MTIHPAYYNNIGNYSLSPMTTKPTTITYPKFNVAEQQQYQQTMSRVNNHELKTRLIPAYVPTSNNVTMTLQHQRQGKRQQQPHSDPLENEEEVISLDASSLPSFGSVRPDPNYDPACDPMNPMNQNQFNKPFVPPSEIIIKTVRGRRRKTVGRGEGRNEEQQQRREQRHSPLQPATQQIQQRPENNQHQSPVLCRSQSPPPLMTPIIVSHAPLQITTPTNSCNPPIVQPMYSAVSKSTTSTTRLSFEEQQLNLHPSTYYDQQYRLEESLSLKLIINDIFNNDNNTTTTDNINDDAVVQQQQEQEQEQEQQNKQRKGMVLRMFGRKVLRFKQKKIDSSNSNDVLGNNTDHNNDDNYIDRVFDAVVNSDIAAAAVVVDNTNTYVDLNSKNNTNNKATNNKKKKNKRYTSMLFTDKSTLMKQGQENNTESSIVV